MAKAKKVNFKLIPEMDEGHEPEPYELLREVRDNWHSELDAAKIALAWKLREQSDMDGHLVLGKCIKVSDLQKEFAEYDFIILLNKEIWEMEFTRAMKVALLDHEMCHAAVATDDETGEVKRDDRGRIVYRMRKHDIEEFQSVVRHHGCYKRDLERFARELMDKSRNPLFRPEADETTVSLQMQNEQGEMVTVMEPMPASEFHNLAAKMSGKVN